jgi:hypothetical protein
MVLAQLYEYTKNHWIVHNKMGELYSMWIQFQYKFKNDLRLNPLLQMKNKILKQLWKSLIFIVKYKGNTLILQNKNIKKIIHLRFMKVNFN